MPTQISITLGFFHAIFDAILALIPRCRLVRGIVGPGGRYFKRHERGGASRSAAHLAEAALDDGCDAEPAPDRRTVDRFDFEDERRVSRDCEQRAATRELGDDVLGDAV